MTRLINDFSNRFKFDTKQTDVKITGNGKIVHWIYRGWSHCYDIKIGHLIPFNCSPTIIKFGIDTKKMVSRGSFRGIGIKWNVGHNSYYFETLPFIIGSRAGYEWDYFEDNISKNRNKEEWYGIGDIIITELNTKTKSIRWWIDGKKDGKNQVFELKFKEAVTSMQFYLHVGSELYGTYYPESVELIPMKYNLFND